MSRGPAPDPVRESALRLLIELDTTGIPAKGRIEQIERGLTRPEDRGFFRVLVTETLRHRLRIDAVLNRLLAHGPVDALPPPIRTALRMGAAQLLVLSGVARHAAVDTSVTLATRFGHRGTAGLVNAVLRKVSREGPALWDAVAEAHGEDIAATLSVRHSHPLWMVRRFLERWGMPRTEAVLLWDNMLPDYWLRERRPRDARLPEPPLTPQPAPSLAPDPEPQPTPASAAALPPGARPGWIPGTARLAPGALQSGALKAGAPRAGALQAGEGDLGDWAVQDGSGILVGHLPPAVRGVVLDLCAAPGSKTGHLADRAEPGGRVVALDLSLGRLRRLRRGLRRVDPIEVVAGDGRRIPIRVPWDGVLIDAPCSSLGTIRRRVDLKWRAREEEIPRLAAIQTALLREAARGVVPGGWLVYSVCTLEPEETTAQRDLFFAEREGWRAAPLPDWIPEGARGREGEMILVPGEFETDGTYAFAALRTE